VEKRGYGALFAIKRTSVSLFFGGPFTEPNQDAHRAFLDGHQHFHETFIGLYQKT